MDEPLDRLAFRFFKLFARFEATLKECEFYRVINNDQIRVDWDRFANEVVGNGFLTDLGPKAASAKSILENPPKKQGANHEKKIIWIDVPSDDHSVQALFGHICRIRNNLYHGAKFNDTWFDPTRSNQLLEHGLTVLEHYSTWLDGR